MRIIESEEAAKRLARVILSDIALYNRDKVEAHEDLEPELDEGRALFRSRVAPQLVPIFSEVVAKSALGGPAYEATAAAPVRRPAAAAPSAAPWPTPPSRPAALEPREAARRLARVMVSGIESQEWSKDGSVLADEIEEARTLFRSCVLPELAPLFEEALEERGLRPAPPPVAEPPRAAAPPAAALPDEILSLADSAEQTDSTDVDPTRRRPSLCLAAEEPPIVVPAGSPAPDWKLSGGRLAAVAVALAAATASVVYLLLT